MQDDLASIAIFAALVHDWEKAISTNKEILKEKDDNVNALSRLAYAYLQTGKINESKRLYHKILTLDQYNMIAQKNLEKISTLPKRFKPHVLSKDKCSSFPINLFIEEPGKTKTVTLTNIAPTSILSKLYVGDPVIICPKKHSIEIRDQLKIYLGALPDDIAFRLQRLIKAGNCYNVCIKNVTKNSISVFIHETKRGKRFASQPSFISSSSDRIPAKKEIKHIKNEDELEEEKSVQEEPEE